MSAEKERKKCTNPSKKEKASEAIPLEEKISYLLSFIYTYGFEIFLDYIYLSVFP